MDAMANNELGKNIETMDLEQVRFLNSGVYDMHKLLNIDNDIAINLPSGPIDTSPTYLATLPFPQYFEEFDIIAEFGTLNVLDVNVWVNEPAGRPDIAMFVQAWVLTDAINIEAGLAFLENSIFTVPEYCYSYIQNQEIPMGNGQQEEYEYFYNFPDEDPVNLFYPYTSGSYWNGETKFYSDNSSVGQIFINDNHSVDLKEDCKLEYNLGNRIGKTLYDSSGHANQGMIIGDYRIKKIRKNEPMGRDSSILVPKKQNEDGAL